MLKAAFLAVAVLAGVLLGIGSPARADEASQSVMSHGLKVYFGFVPAEIARGIAKTHGQSEMHGAEPSTSTEYHLVVAIFNAVTGSRITNAKVSAGVTRPGFEPPSKQLEPMKIADTITYGNFFDLPSEGIYRIRLNISRKGTPRPIEIDLTYDHGGHKPS